jgi:hypothetical protein
MDAKDLHLDIQALEEELLAFERKYGLKSEAVYAAYIAGEEPEQEAWTMDFGEWASVYRTWLSRQSQREADALSHKKRFDAFHRFRATVTDPMDEDAALALALEAQQAVRAQVQETTTRRIPSLDEIRALAMRLHEDAHPYQGRAWGWEVTYDPEVMEPDAKVEVPDGKGGFITQTMPLWMAASFTIGESGV